MSRILVLLLSLALLGQVIVTPAMPAMAQGTPEACPSPDPAANAQVVRDWYAAIDARDIEAFDDVMAPIIVQHAADFANAQGLEEVKTNFAPFLAAFSDLQHDLEDVVAADDLVAVRVHARGVNQGDFMGIPATGDEVTWTSLAIYRIECGKIAEHWSEVNAVGRLQELGAIPEIVPAAVNDTAADSAMTSTDAECAATTPEENATLVGEWLAAGDNEATGAAEAVAHGALARVAEADTVAALATALVAAFPDLQVTPDMIFAEGDRVVVRWTGTGTHSGSTQDYPATGNPISFTANSIVRISCGQIAEVWTEADLLALLRQVDAVTWPPAPAATPDAE